MMKAEPCQGLVAAQPRQLSKMQKRENDHDPVLGKDGVECLSHVGGTILSASFPVIRRAGPIVQDGAVQAVGARPAT